MARKNRTTAQVQNFVAARSPRAVRPSDTNTVDWDELDDPIEDSAEVAAAMAGRDPDGDLTERDLDFDGASIPGDLRAAMTAGYGVAERDLDEEVEGEDFDVVEVGVDETTAPFESEEDDDDEDEDVDAPMFWYANEADARWFCDYLTKSMGEQMYVVELVVKGERRLYVMTDADIAAGGHGANVLSGAVAEEVPA